jgi:HNH endonuclease
METIEMVDVGVSVAGMASLEVLEAEICRGAANLTAAESVWLGLVAEFDRRRGWELWGCASCAAWLSWQVGLDLRAAREKVRVAHALEEFSLLRAAMTRGELSYSKLRAITRIATPATEADLLSIALAGTSNHVERVVAAYRRSEAVADTADADAFHERSVYSHTAEATMEITVRLPVEAGLALLGAIEHFVVDDRGTPRAARRADALVELAEHAVAHLDTPVDHDPRYLVTLTIDPDTFTPNHDHDHDGGGGHDQDDSGHGGHNGEERDDRGGGGRGAKGDGRGGDGGGAKGDGRGGDDSDGRGRGTGGGGGGGGGGGRCEITASDGHSGQPVSVPLSSARRILCDAALETLLTDLDGTPLHLGRRTRVVRRRLRRAVHLRDGRCRFPGCTRRGWLDAHHIVHWLDGGPTDIDNLLSLCRFHHRLVHEAH